MVIIGFVLWADIITPIIVFGLLIVNQRLAAKAAARVEQAAEVGGEQEGGTAEGAKPGVSVKEKRTA